MIELDQDHGAVNSVAKDRVGIATADPREVSLVEMQLYLIQSNASVLVAKIAHVKIDELEQLQLLLGREPRSGKAGVIEHEIISSRLRHEEVARIVEAEHCQLSLLVVQQLMQLEREVLLVLQNGVSG